MPEWELRPLSLGEILDRTFSLYRRHFLLFAAIMAIPHLLYLGMNLAQVLLLMPRNPLGTVGGGTTTPPNLPSTGLLAFGFVGLFVGIIVYFFALLMAQGGTIFAVSDLYLGHPAGIAASLRRVLGHLGKLLGLTIVNFLAIGVGLLLLLAPGVYLACRLIVGVPAALLEDRGVFESMERSFDLTQDNAGRAFIIYLLYVALIWGVSALFSMPFMVLFVFATVKDPSLVRISLVLMQIGSFLAGVLVGPFLLIASSVFYYDLRVRKEAFDLQMLMNPAGVPTAGTQVPSVLS